MMQLIELFQQNQWQIIFASPANLGEHRHDLGALDITEQQITVNDSAFDDFIKDLKPDVVIFDRFMMEEQFGWRVAEHCPKAIRILNTEDLHSLRDIRHKLLKKRLSAQTAPNLNIDLSTLGLDTPDQLMPLFATSDLAKREIAAIYRSDLTLMISEFELQLLLQRFGVAEPFLNYLPFQFAKGSSTSRVNDGFEQRDHFISIGNFRHAPNWDAVLWLKQEIWPLIRQQLPQAQLHIYGAYLPPKASALHNDQQGFLIKGWVKDAEKVMRQARVCVAPLRFGAGIKGKLADAMRCGTPSVTTLIGSEAMQSHDISWPGAIANQAEDFAQKAIALYGDKTLWHKSQSNGYQLFSQRFLDKTPSEQFWQQLTSIQSNLQQHRQANFIGAMLNHHHHKSTQYMAQWIEAKNALKT
ncbi:glycosyltransferase family 4 protein [Thiomicrorhabdus sediminis]|uniref:Glycosyltransferase family 4 protein n=2 Tax=Thiomicrorhabdus sediminis TaxID=2580412 RepID=A0A4P9K7K6_9GAMM|nr:glycosyltransferase family 4 protein [Thiomicrorhabdus sediminis]